MTCRDELKIAKEFIDEIYNIGFSDALKEVEKVIAQLQGYDWSEMAGLYEDNDSCWIDRDDLNRRISELNSRSLQRYGSKTGDSEDTSKKDVLRSSSGSANNKKRRKK